MQSPEERAGIMRAHVRRAAFYAHVAPGQLWWERNGINDRSPGTAVVLILRQWSDIIDEAGTVEKSWLVLVTEEDGRIYLRQSHRFIICDEECSKRIG